MAKKTVPLKEIIEIVNKKLADNAVSQAEKKSICVLLENLLHTNEAYCGFNYIKWLGGGYSEWLADGKPERKTEEDNLKYHGKEFDRVYYLHQDLRS